MMLIVISIVLFPLRYHHYLAILIIATLLALSSHAISSVGNRDQIQPKPYAQDGVRWYFISYHKTGWEISLKIVQLLERSNITKVAYFPILTSYGWVYYHFRFSMFRNDIRIVRMHSPLLHKRPWPRHSPDRSLEYRYIHHVRDPLDMIVSGFLYHSQYPSPEDFEMRSRNTTVALCRSSRKAPSHLHNYYSTLVNFTKSRERVDTIINGLHSYCLAVTEKLNKLLPPVVGLNYSQLLTAARGLDGDEFNAIRVHALWAILGHDDVIRMAINSLQTNPRHTLHLYISDFPAHNEGVYRGTLERMYRFLTQGVAEERNRFWSTLLPMENLVYLTLAELSPSSSNQARKPVMEMTATHITQGFISKERRLVYTQQLHKDPHIGPMLGLVKEMLTHASNRD